MFICIYVVPCIFKGIERFTNQLTRIAVQTLHVRIAPPRSGSGPFFRIRIWIRGSGFRNPDPDPGDPKRPDPTGTESDRNRIQLEPDPTGTGSGSATMP